MDVPIVRPPQGDRVGIFRHAAMIAIIVTPAKAGV
jgi:hypothetical protein